MKPCCQYVKQKVQSDKLKGITHIGEKKSFMVDLMQNIAFPTTEELQEKPCLVAQKLKIASF